MNPFLFGMISPLYLFTFLGDGLLMSSSELSVVFLFFDSQQTVCFIFLRAVTRWMMSLSVFLIAVTQLSNDAFVFRRKVTVDLYSESCMFLKNKKIVCNLENASPGITSSSDCAVKNLLM